MRTRHMHTYTQDTMLPFTCEWLSYCNYNYPHHWEDIYITISTVRRDVEGKEDIWEEQSQFGLSWIW